MVTRANTALVDEIRSLITAATEASEPRPETLLSISYRLRRNASTTPHRRDNRAPCTACTIVEAAELLASIGHADQVVIQ